MSCLEELSYSPPQSEQVVLTSLSFSQARVTGADPRIEAKQGMHTYNMNNSYCCVYYRVKSTCIHFEQSTLSFLNTAAVTG